MLLYLLLDQKNSSSRSHHEAQDCFFWSRTHCMAKKWTTITLSSERITKTLIRLFNDVTNPHIQAHKQALKEGLASCWRIPKIPFEALGPPGSMETTYI